jgi:hypothetical protein
MGRAVTCGYHCTAKPLSFGRGQSAVHTAAYNARTQLEHEREDKLTKDYGKSHGAPLFTGIFAPEGAPEWARDREQLWNRAEAAERQKVNGQPARNLIVAFPQELDQREREWLLKDFAREEFARRGMIADVAMHEPDKHGDQRNFHAHILLTMRKLDGDEFAKTKCREWNSKEQLEAWREGWAERGAKALHRAGHPIEAERWRHGHETLAAQRTAAVARGDMEYADSIQREATIHKGPKLSGMERRSGREAAGDRLDELRGILDRNEIRLDMKALERELRALEKEQAKQQVQADATRAGAAERGRPAQSLGATERPHAAIEAEHAAAETARQRRQGVEPKREDARHETGGTKKAASSPSPAAAGLQVVDGATGLVSRLGDFMLDLLAGSPAPAPEKPADMKAFVTDPAARKEQQLARMAARGAAERDEKALDRIADDMKAGKALSASDIRNLTLAHQMQIKHFGDDGVRQMVEDAQKRAERYWKGNERERER